MGSLAIDDEARDGACDGASPHETASPKAAAPAPQWPFAALANAMLQHDPARRPSALDLCRMLGRASCAADA
eukprot:7224756-Prymnesium_polylepis.1